MNQEEAEKIALVYKKITGINCQTSYMNVPHIPTTLEKDKEQGVYVFLNSTQTYKVGKAGTRSQARWNSHHYNLDKSTPSSLPKSILSDLSTFKSFFPDSEQESIENLNSVTIKDWIRTNLTRIEFKIPSTATQIELNLLEALVQFYCKPLYEGRQS